MQPEQISASGGEAEAFEQFVREHEPHLRRALIAHYGRERGREATAEALAWAWEHRSQLASMEKPVAYLYRVGQSKTRPRRVPTMFERPASDESSFEPGLGRALARLSQRQRVAVLLVDSAGWTYEEVADLFGVRATTVEKHLERGRARLRRLMGARQS